MSVFYISGQFSQNDLSVVDRIHLFDWAPSTTMTLQNFKEVLEDLVWGCRQFERTDLNKALFRNKFTHPPPPPQPSSSDQASTSQPAIPATELFLHFRVKEASGIPLLGTMLAEFARNLSAQGRVAYKVDLEFPVIISTIKRGQRPACDGALCASLLQTSDLGGTRPQVLYEYKPRVDTRLMAVDPNDLMEVVLQGYYCLCQYKLETVLHCLTDLQQWYYFQLKREDNKVRCLWYTEFHSETPEKVAVSSHVHFLGHCTSKTSTT